MAEMIPILMIIIIVQCSQKKKKNPNRNDWRVSIITILKQYGFYQ